MPGRSDSVDRGTCWSNLCLAPKPRIMFIRIRQSYCDLRPTFACSHDVSLAEGQTRKDAARCGKMQQHRKTAQCTDKRVLKQDYTVWSKRVHRANFPLFCLSFRGTSCRSKMLQMKALESHPSVDNILSFVW